MFYWKEFIIIFGIYGMGVVNGEWRDYVIDYFSDVVVFSIF